MKLDRLPPTPSSLADFYQEGLEHLGALCERTWHDRLHVLAEGRAAAVWDRGGELFDTELLFLPPDHAGPRDAAREVFPGCPLTFRLAERISTPTLCLDRVALEMPEHSKPPSSDALEKLWLSQNPSALRWTLNSPPMQDWHFSALFLARCEIQAIDQRWSMHRVVVSLADGNRDENLASGLETWRVNTSPDIPIQWPLVDVGQLKDRLQRAMLEELDADLSAIRLRQTHYLRRELGRIDDYFLGYERELIARIDRQRKDEAKGRIEHRLAAAKVEHERRRQDQVQRHEMRLVVHVDALLLLAEPAWRASVSAFWRSGNRSFEALFVPRVRRWIE